MSIFILILNYFVIENYKENEHFIYVVVPCYNFDKFIYKCLESVSMQKYKKYKCIIVNDGSTDNSKKIIDKFTKKYKNFSCLNYKENNGPAFSKYKGFMEVKKISKPNDVIMVLDGDDYLIGDNVFSLINNTYNNSKCWFTYGSYVGKFSEQVKDISNLKIKNYRKDKWYYGHPRSFKTFLLDFFNEKDFKYKDNTWLKKGTDTAFVYKCLELSGIEKIKFIKDKIYYYREHGNNTYKKLDKKFRDDQINHTANKKPFPQYFEPIHIVMCSWKRTKNIPIIIKSLNEQTVAKRIVFNIINNNIKEKDNINKILKNLKNNKIKINIQHNKVNGYGFERFKYTRNLLKRTFIDYVIFIDDDQYFDKKFIENLYNLREPKSYKSWYGRYFKKDSEINNLSSKDYGEYYSNKIVYTDLIKNRKKEIKTMPYMGTGGSIIDANIFNFEKLYSIKKEYINVEDMWLSFICSHYNWKLERTFIVPKKIESKETETEAQWLTMGTDHKCNFIKFMRRNYNWPSLY